MKSSTRRTTTPGQRPPRLVCPTCDWLLTYRESFVSGVGKDGPDQWDVFDCRRCKVALEYRHRTKRLRRMTS